MESSLITMINSRGTKDLSNLSSLVTEFVHALGEPGLEESFEEEDEDTLIQA